MKPSEEGISLRQLDIFCRVAEKQSFSKAAQSVYLTQPTVSEHVAALEKLLGVQLLDRVGRKVKLTRAGRIYYKYAKKIMDLRGEAQQVLDSFLGLLHGRLTIGASTIPGVYIAPGIVGAFSREYPAIRVMIHVGDSGEIIDEVADGNIEVGFVGRKPKGTVLTARPLASDSLVVALPPGHKWEGRDEVEVAELVKEPFLLREPGSGTRAALEDALARKRISLEKEFNIAAELGSTEAIMQGIREGLGISVVSDIAVAADCEHCRLKTVRMKEISIQRRFYCIYLKKHALAPAARAFLSHIESEGKASKKQHRED
jgi:DNA-binding transcriptional LysR family regulator